MPETVTNGTLLTNLQRKQLISKINSIKIDTALKYFQSGDIGMNDVPHISADRKQYIEEQLNNMPNPMEQNEWTMIERLLGSPSQKLLDLLSAYVRKWKESRPANNHVDDAQQQITRIEAALEKEAEFVEKADWNNVDFFSQTDLIGHLSKYPNTIHKNEIDDNVWNLTDKENIQEIQIYISKFPNGLHSDDAKDLLNAIEEWSNVKNTNDIFMINDYVRNNPDSPFNHQAKILILQLKQEEIKQMKSSSHSSYEINRLKKLIDNAIVSKYDLINEKVMTETVFTTLLNTDIRADLPDIRTAIETSKAECKEGYTDVFFFGVPSTGKTCVLMGLSRSSSLNINLASGGGDYAAALQQYTDVGVTVPPTPGTFVTTLEATIKSRSTNSVHKINLVEMSGEEFAFGIANNPDHVFTFEDMGSGATKLLRNNNHKVFFLIIDPTANVVRINREVIDGVDEKTGTLIKHLESCVVNQRTIIQKMVNLFQNPGNADIMKKVDAIHIIMTKSDTLGNVVEREDRAYKIFKEKFSDDILEPLIQLCNDYVINTPDYRPKLYTFSLGEFFIGGLYEYERTDSNRLVRAIRNSTHSLKKKTWWDKLKETVN